MPEGTAVDKLYKKLRAEGHSEESAARIAQSMTGEALATGKPPKGKENAMPKVEVRRQSSNEANISQRYVTYDLYVDGKYQTTYKDVLDAMDAKERIEKGRKVQNSTSFQNGRLKAEREIGEKASK